VTEEVLSLSKPNKHKFTTQLAACRMTIAYAFYPIS